MRQKGLWKWYGFKTRAFECATFETDYHVVHTVCVSFLFQHPDWFDMFHPIFFMYQESLSQSIESCERMDLEALRNLCSSVQVLCPRSRKVALKLCLLLRIYVVQGNSTLVNEAFSAKGRSTWSPLSPPAGKEEDVLRRRQRTSRAVATFLYSAFMTAVQSYSSRNGSWSRWHRHSWSSEKLKRPRRNFVKFTNSSHMKQGEYTTLGKKSLEPEGVVGTVGTNSSVELTDVLHGNAEEIK